MTAEITGTPESIHTAALKRFHYLSDLSCFGKMEYWAALDQLQNTCDKTGEIDGDCDDFATWCVGHMREAGLTARYVFCQCETGEYHLVAEANGLILDNRQLAPLPINRLDGYIWHSISGTSPGDAWHEITGSTYG